MALSDKQRVEVFRTLARAMAFDRLMMRLIRSGRLVGFYHEGGIALAPGVAAGFFLAEHDILWPHYRAHGVAHLLVKRVDVTPYIAEHLGGVGGCCKGRSSFHISYPEHHIFGLSGNIGANFPSASAVGSRPSGRRAVKS